MHGGTKALFCVLLPWVVMAYFHCCSFFLAVPKAIRNLVGMKLSTCFLLNATIIKKNKNKKKIEKQMSATGFCGAPSLWNHFITVRADKQTNKQKKSTTAGLETGFGSECFCKQLSRSLWVRLSRKVFITQRLIRTQLNIQWKWSASYQRDDGKLGVTARMSWINPGTHVKVHTREAGNTSWA